MDISEQKKKRTFHKFTYRSVNLDQLLDLSYLQLMQLYSACPWRRLNLGLSWKAALAAKVAVYGQKRGNPQGENRGGEDTPVGRARVA
ncbi:40S ribosomal protein S15 [Sciurus carolinensis]|uniref:40S ribosomal protein S15 n=1 Tax=Sciurus carolinensis TaxID=30640 RepID=A0AA41ML45_SCICA|nr:40S ribosomal protein S15 [Sciurus carolinensis]